MQAKTLTKIANFFLANFSSISVLISLFQSANHTPSFKSHIYDQPTCCCVVSNGSSVISAVEFPL